eukprot:1319590-Prymnesium_polylepis.1
MLFSSPNKRLTDLIAKNNRLGWGKALINIRANSRFDTNRASRGAGGCVKAARRAPHRAQGSRPRAPGSPSL